MTEREKLQLRGIRRLGSPKSGFRYLRPGGRPVPGRDRDRIRSLAIPPAWRDVTIHPDPRAKLQAIGRDARGRWQYRYHPAFRQRREAQKYTHMVEFGKALPRMRRRVIADLRRRGLPREKVLAAAIRIMGSCFIRPGSGRYAAENRSYGIATLRNTHVQVKGSRIELDFVGKSGKRHHVAVRDPRVATIVRAMKKVPGRELFKYVLDDGHVVDVRRRHINQYIQEVMGESFTAKDFRTWAGTLICACALARAAKSRTVRKKALGAALAETAAQLGNTPAVSRKSYIYPQVLSSFDRGQVVDSYFHSVEDFARCSTPHLHRSERALLSLLKQAHHAE